jgi:hypothetical protein
MKKLEWKKHHGFLDREMAEIEFLLDQGCRITAVLPEPTQRWWGNEELKRHGPNALNGWQFK